MVCAGTKRYGLVFSGLLIAGLLLLAGPAGAAVHTLNEGDSILQNISDAAAGDTIVLNPGTYPVSGSGFGITKDLTITSNATLGSAADTMIDGLGVGTGIFYVYSGNSLTLNNLTLRNGYRSDGGAIYNRGTVTITGSRITGCRADSQGGALYNMGTATIISSTFDNCHSASQAGAILNSGTLSVVSSTFTSCWAVAGGAIASGGTMTLRDSAFIGCSATAHGGAIFNAGTTSIFSSSFTGSRAQYGGAIYNFNWGSSIISSLRFCRFANNSATTSGGAIFNGISSTIPDATDTWWGGNSDPIGGFGGNPNFPYDPWLQLGATGSPSAITATGSSVIRANLTFDTSPADTSASGHIPNGTRVDFAVVSGPGSLSAASNQTTLGAAETTMTPTGTGTVNISATVDSQTVYTEIPVTDAPAPSVSGITPDTGINSSSIAITSLAGTDFWMHGTTAVMLTRTGYSSIPATGVTVVSPSQITCTLPITGAETGAWDVLVINPDGKEAGLPGGFTITAPAPAISAITPATGMNTSAVSITNLAGSGFLTGAVVNLTRAGHANITATGVTLVSSAQITCSLPVTGAEAGAWDVVVTNPDGQEAVLTNGFAITAPAPTTIPTTVPTAVPTSTQQGTGETLSDFPSSPANPLMTVTVKIGGDSKAWQAIVTGTKLSDLIVTGAEQHSPVTGYSPPAGSVFQYLGLEPARYGTITNAVINFTIPQSWLDENHIAPGSVVLYHMTPDCWQPLPTTFLSMKDGTAYFSGQSAGFSHFAIAGTPAVLTPPAIVAAPAAAEPPLQESPAATALVPRTPVTMQTTAPPVPPEAPAGSSGLPVVTIASVALCGAGFVSLGWYLRRRWIHRQNPVLFRDK